MTRPNPTPKLIYRWAYLLCSHGMCAIQAENVLLTWLSPDVIFRYGESPPSSIDESPYCDIVRTIAEEAYFEVRRTCADPSALEPPWAPGEKNWIEDDYADWALCHAQKSGTTFD